MSGRKKKKSLSRKNRHKETMKSIKKDIENKHKKKERGPLVPPNKVHKDKSKYERKKKHSSGQERPELDPCVVENTEREDTDRLIRTQPDYGEGTNSLGDRLERYQKKNVKRKDQNKMYSKVATDLRKIATDLLSDK